jgi:hypothetical protein
MNKLAYFLCTGSTGWKRKAVLLPKDASFTKIILVIFAYHETISHFICSHLLYFWDADVAKYLMPQLDWMKAWSCLARTANDSCGRNSLIFSCPDNMLKRLRLLLVLDPTATIFAFLII